MAKAKKTETPAADSTPKPAAKKATKVKAPSPAQSGSPMIDTGLAAESAAKFLVARLNKPNANTGTPAKESSTFKNLKESLANPAATSMANVLGKNGPLNSTKNNQASHGGNQTGRNQTFGADVNRSGVPRRTGGG